MREREARISIHDDDHRMTGRERERERQKDGGNFKEAIKLLNTAMGIEVH